MRLDGQDAAFRHRVARVDHQVHDHLLELARVHRDHRQRRIKGGADLDILPEHAGQHAMQVVEDLVDVHQLRLQHLAPREGEELAGERRRAIGGLQDLLDVLARPRVGELLVEGKRGEAANRGQQIIEVVGDAAGESPHRLHALRDRQLFAHLLLHRDVGERTDHPLGDVAVPGDDRPFLDVGDRAVAALEAEAPSALLLMRRQRLGQLRLGMLPVVGVQSRLEPLARRRDAGAVEEKEVVEGLVPDEFPAGGAPLPDRLLGHARDEAMALLRHAQGVEGADPVGHVERQHHPCGSPVELDVVRADLGQERAAVAPQVPEDSRIAGAALRAPKRLVEERLVLGGTNVADVHAQELGNGVAVLRDRFGVHREEGERLDVEDPDRIRTPLEHAAVARLRRLERLCRGVSRGELAA